LRDDLDAGVEQVLLGFERNMSALPPWNSLRKISWKFLRASWNVVLEERLRLDLELLRASPSASAALLEVGDPARASRTGLSSASSSRTASRLTAPSRSFWLQQLDLPAAPQRSKPDPPTKRARP
jgi:hypothetical protein